MNKEVFKQNEESLKNKWRQLITSHDRGFIWDGIIDYDQWINYDLKLLFIAKEGYTRNGDSLSEWDIAEAYNEDNGLFKVGRNANQSTHNRLVEWAFAIDAAMHLKEITKLEVVQENDRQAARPVMMKSSFINIKKIDGKTSSNDKDLQKVALRDKELLKAQISLINPNVILFCGTFKYLHDKLFENSVKIPGTKFCYEREGVLLIEFFHPLGFPVESYYTLFEDLQSLPDVLKYLK